MGRTRQSFDLEARRFERMRVGLGKVQGDGLYMIGQEIMTDVKASRPGRGVPRDTGNLASTGTVERMAGRRVLLAFGGAAAPYAMRQHEEMDYRHDVGEPRYLVRGVERWRPDGSAAMRAMKANAEAAVRRAAR